MSDTLAKYYIEVANKGFEEANRKIGDVNETLKKSLDQAKKNETQFERLQKLVVAFGGVAANVYSAAYGWITKFTSAAMQQTVEATHLSKSFEILNRQIGDIFAPYVRALTVLIRELSKMWRSLTEDTKALIAQVVLVVAAVTSLTVIIPVVVAGFSALMTVLSALLSPIGLVAAAIGGIVYAFQDSLDASYDWADGFGTTVAWIAKTWDYAKAVFSAGSTFAVSTLRNMMDVSFDLGYNWDKIWKWVADNWYKLLKDMLYNAWQIVKNIANLFKELAQAVWKWIKSGFKEWDFDFADQFKGLLDNIRRSTDDFPDVIRKNLRDPVADAKKVWEDSTKDIESNFERRRRSITETAKGIANAFSNAKEELNNRKGFQMQGDVGFETFKQSHERLQLAFANPNSQAQLMQAMVSKTADVAKNTQVIAGNTSEMKNRQGMAQ